MDEQNTFRHLLDSSPIEEVVVEDIVKINESDNSMFNKSMSAGVEKSFIQVEKSNQLSLSDAEKASNSS